MELLVIFFDALEHLNRLLDGRLVHLDRLEAAFERSILLDVLAVFVEGGCTNDLNLSAGKRWFEDVCRIHRAFRIAGAHQTVYLVNEQDGVAHLAHVVKQSLDAAFKLPAELGPRYQRGHIQQVQLLALQHSRNISLCQLLRNAFCNRSLADAGFTDQARVVFGSSIEDLDDSLDLFIPADDVVDLAVLCLLGQVFTVSGQELVLFAFLFLLALFL